ncbi:regulatory subunit of cyclin-dependent kinase [Chlamydoabsidia padenii]|nr:regulatory subunit of cyclin-dependent kinase [Chlamydoabsidia padenii]
MKRASSSVVDLEQPITKRPQLDQPPTNNNTDQSTTQDEAKAEKRRRARERMQRDVATFREYIKRSPIYKDDEYQYRHIILPPQIAAYLPDRGLKRLLIEREYRQLGISISSGWEHYMIYRREPNILLLRRSHEVTRKLEAQYKLYLQQKKETETMMVAQDKQKESASTQQGITTKATTSSTKADLK